MIKSLFSIFRESACSFEGQKEGEEILLLLRRHVFTIYIRIGFYIFLFLAPIVIGLAFYSYLLNSGWFDVFFFFSTIWYLGLWIAVFHALTIYSLSTVLITNRRIIDSDQHGLFNRKVAELNSSRIQDVSTHINGVIQTFLHFGDVTVQTAASEKQFIFHQVPRPEHVKDIITQMAASAHTGVKTTVKPNPSAHNLDL